jgi:hypothetical protein
MVLDVCGANCACRRRTRHKEKTMKKSAFAVFAALALSTALAAGFKPIETKGADGTGAAQSTVFLSRLNGSDFNWETLQTSRIVGIQITIPTFALGAIESSKLGQALKLESIQAPEGFAVQFKQHQFIGNADRLKFDTTVPRNTRRGDYNITLNLSNPLTKDSGAVSYKILVR